MAGGTTIDSSLEFDRVVIRCGCASRTVGIATVHDGDPTVPQNLKAWVPKADNGMWDEDNAEVAEVIRRVRLPATDDDHCDVYWRDGSTIFAEADLPDGFAVMRKMHPFHTTDAWKIDNVLLDHGGLATDSTTGRRSIEVQTDLRSAFRVPDSDPYRSPWLRRWKVAPHATDNDAIILWLDVHPDDQVESGDFTDSWVRNLPGMREMEAFLRSLADTLDETDEIDTGMDDFRSPEFTGVLQWEVDTGEEVRFTIPEVVNTLLTGSPLKIARVGIVCKKHSASPNDWDEDSVQEYLDSSYVDTPVDGRPLEACEVGGARSLARAEQYYFAGTSTYLYRRSDGHLIDVHEDALGGRHETPLSGGFGEAVRFNSLPIVSGELYRRWPTRPYVKEVYFDGAHSGDRDLMLPTPASFVGSKDRDRPMVISNIATTDPSDGSNRLRLRGWSSSDHFMTLYPGERAVFLMRQKSGGAGTLISTSAPTRHLLYAMEYDQPDEANDLDKFHMWKRLDTVEGTVNGSAIVLPQPSVSLFDFLHDDFFELYTTDFADDLAIFSQTTAAAVKKKGAIRILRETTGFLQVDISINARTDSDWSGNIDFTEMRLLRFTGSEVEDYARQFTENVWQGNQPYNFRLVHRGRISKDDILIPCFWYPDGSTFGGLDDLQGRRMTVEMTVEPQITLERA